MPKHIISLLAIFFLHFKTAYMIKETLITHVIDLTKHSFQARCQG